LEGHAKDHHQSPSREAALALCLRSPPKPASKPAHPTTPAKCKVHSGCYNAKGTLVSQNLAQTAGVNGDRATIVGAATVTVTTRRRTTR